MQRRLLAWYDAHRRDLPWRGLDDPYAIWISEIMLQQTRVETVIPYFLRWLERFPDVATLAAADEDTVLRSWSGLGYYSRARNLHRAAKVVVAHHAGGFPADRDGLRALPGIGAYTSGAIASIAFGEAVPAVDGNVLRVLARLLGDERDILDPASRRHFEAQAARLVAPDRPGDWNQALMELGATVCTPTRPDCATCPLESGCAAFAAGRTADLPVRRKRRAPMAEAVHFAWLTRDDHLLLVRHPRDGLLGGLWGLPGGNSETPLEDHVWHQAGVRIHPGRALGTTGHRFTHRAWTMTVVAGTMRPGTAKPQADTRWVPLADLRQEAVSTAHRKLIDTARVALESSPQDRREPDAATGPIDRSTDQARTFI